MLPTSQISTLFPYTTLFRSSTKASPRSSGPATCSPTRTRSTSSTGASIASTTLPRRGCTDEQQARSEEHTSELQSLRHLVCRLLLEKKKTYKSKSIKITLRE